MAWTSIANGQGNAIMDTYRQPPDLSFLFIFILLMYLLLSKARDVEQKKVVPNTPEKPPVTDLNHTIEPVKYSSDYCPYTMQAPYR